MTASPKNQGKMKRAAAAAGAVKLNKPRHQKYSQEYARWKKILKEACPTYEDALNLLAWTIASNVEIEKELSWLSNKKSEVMATTQLLSNPSLPGKTKLKIIKDRPENGAIKIAKLAIKARTSSTAKSGGDGKAVAAVKKDDLIEKKFKKDRAKYEKYSAREAAIYMEKHNPKLKLKVSTLQRKISQWRKESL